MNPLTSTDKNDMTDKLENRTQQLLSDLEEHENKVKQISLNASQETQFQEENLMIQSLPKRKFYGQWSQEENSDVSTNSSQKANGHVFHCINDEKAYMNNHISCTKQCFTHNNNNTNTTNNNLVIDKGNLRCSDEKSCCFYMKFPLKVNNNVFPEKTLNMKDGMEDYFEQFSATTSAAGMRNLDEIEGSSHTPRSFECDGGVTGGGGGPPSFPDPINALNGEEEDEDEGCIYTYKGDNYEANLSHLLQTCFNCGLPTTERSGGQNGAVSIQRILNGSPHPNPNPQSNLYSPEMDFLEMDFDPGSNGDGGDSDCEDNNSVLTVDTKAEEKPLESFIKLQTNTAKKTNNISNELRSLMCSRCEMCVYNEQKVNNTSTSLGSKAHSEPGWSGNLQSNSDAPGSSSVIQTSGETFTQPNVVEEESSHELLEAFQNVTSGSRLATAFPGKDHAEGFDKDGATAASAVTAIENNLNVFERNLSDDFSDAGDEADDEGGDDSTSDVPPPLETGMMFDPSSRERLNALRNPRSVPSRDSQNTSFNLKATKQLRFAGVNSLDKCSNGNITPVASQKPSSFEASDHLADCNKETYYFKDSVEKCENNNLGSISAPEVSPSKEYTPLEKFSRSISFHNQLSSPKYENVCFTHPYKDNFLPSITKYQSSACTSHDHCGCKHLSCSCKISQDLQTTNLEACVDRLTQREKSVFNITSSSLNSAQESSSEPNNSDCLGSNGTSSATVNQDIQNGKTSSTSGTLGPLPLKILQPKVADPFRDPNTVSEEDLEKEQRTEGEGCQVEKTMIWTERQATLRQVSQVGTSACGPTAVINVLLALGHSRPVKVVTSAIKTRLRAENAPLVDYLLSRANAGTTHEDLIKGIETVSEGAVRGRFFNMFPKRAFQLSRWLSGWIKKGGVPVATLNLQVGVPPGQTVPDAWHHQMVFGVGPLGIYLTNPLECVSDSLLADQLCSDSVLLVRRSDIVSRWDQNDKVIRLSLQMDPSWNEMNVLGQVVGVLKEEAAPEMLQGRRHLTSHVAIPASYQSGVSVFMRADNDCLQELLDSSELPLLDE